MAPDSVRESILEFLNSSKPSRRAGDTRCPCGSRMTREDNVFLRRPKLGSDPSGLPQVLSGTACPNLLRRIAR
jgi:hypothetical protein